MNYREPVEYGKQVVDDDKYRLMHDKLDDIETLAGSIDPDLASDKKGIGKEIFILRHAIESNVWPHIWCEDESTPPPAKDLIEEKISDNPYRQRLIDVIAEKVSALGLNLTETLGELAFLLFRKTTRKELTNTELETILEFFNSIENQEQFAEQFNQLTLAKLTKVIEG